MNPSGHPRFREKGETYIHEFRGGLYVFHCYFGESHLNHTNFVTTEHQEKAHLHPLKEDMAFVEHVQAKPRPVNNLAIVIVFRKTVGSNRS